MLISVLITVFFAVITSTGANVLYSNVPGGRVVIFPNQYNGLPWPIHKASEISSVTWHGVHCVEILKECFANKIVNIPAEFIHVEHCRRYIQHSIDFFEQTPTYHVHKIICDDIKDLVQSYQLSAATNALKRAGKSRGIPEFSIRETDHHFDGADIDDPDGTISQSAFQNYFESHPEIVGNDEVFNSLAALNSGNILVKAMNNYTLTEAESAHMAEWRSPRSYRFASMALYCILGSENKAPVDILKTMLSTPCAG